MAEELKAGDMVLKILGDYVVVPDGTPLEAHVETVKTVETQKYQEPETMVKKLAIGIAIDVEGDAAGQVYSKWFTPSLNPKSALSKLVAALYPGVDVAEVDPTEFIGRPLQIILGSPDKETGRQNIETFLKPTSNQKVVTAEEVAEIFAEEAE